MIIMSQSGDKIIDWSKVNKVYLVGNSVVIGMSDKDYSTYGKYRTNEQANLIVVTRTINADILHRSFHTQKPKRGFRPDIQLQERCLQH